MKQFGGHEFYGETEWQSFRRNMLKSSFYDLVLWRPGRLLARTAIRLFCEEHKLD